jgi:hypothetical protein
MLDCSFVIAESGKMKILGWIGIFVGATSLFSLLERFAHFGLAPRLDTMLSAYRTGLFPVADKIIVFLRYLLRIINVNMPWIPPEIIVLYTLFSLAILHFTFSEQTTLRKQFGNLSVGIALSPLIFFWPVLLAGNTAMLLISPRLGVRNITLGWDLELAKIIGVCLILLGVNAYLL